MDRRLLRSEGAAINASYAQARAAASNPLRDEVATQFTSREASAGIPNGWIADPVLGLVRSAAVREVIDVADAELAAYWEERSA